MASPSTSSSAAATAEEGVRRRDFIHVASGTFFAGGAALVAWPLIDQMNPSADVLALSTTEVDIASVVEGQTIRVMFRGKPVFIKHRTAAEIEAANQVDVATLRDPQTDADRVKEGKAQWLITLGVCTHLGCVPLGAAQGEAKGEYNGYFCPCHGSHYDTSGRIRKGPAPLNLEVPEYVFKTDTNVLIG
jgi:ubiquinol-cytochrome c reductase iron-sulfur subunit